MRKPKLAPALLAAALAAVVAAAAAGAAAPGFTVIARGLDNPRGVWAQPNGFVYVAEAGSAGPSCDPKGENCLGFTSRVERFLGQNKRQQVVGSIVSAGGQDGSFTVGADGVAVDRTGAVYFVVTAFPECGPPTGVPPRAAGQFGKLLRAGGGGVSAVADIAALECKNNYDGTDRNANPYAVAAVGPGHLVVVDAGANALFDVRDGKATLLAVLPKTAKGLQSVPTSIAVGADGSYYVGEFTGETKGVKRAGEARIFKIVPGQKPTVAASGFNAVTGVAVAPDGTLYVTEFQMNADSQEDPRGDVVKVTPDGKRTRLGVGKLFFPAGAALDPNGAVYVSNWSILPGKAPASGPFKGKTGELVRLAG